MIASMPTRWLVPGITKALSSNFAIISIRPTASRRDGAAAFIKSSIPWGIVG